MKYKTVNKEKKNTPYSDAVEIGDFIQFSGMLGLGENGLVDGGVEAETHQIFKNLKEGLDYYGLDYSNVVKSLVMLKNMDDFPKFNEIYVSYFNETLPVRSSFGVTDLAIGGCVEIEFLAHK